MLEIKNIDSVELIFNGVSKRLDSNETYTIPESDRINWSQNNEVLAALSDEKLEVYVSGTLQPDLNSAINALKGSYSEVKIVEDNANQQPFASKVLSNGDKLFRRKHGVTASVPANSSETITITVPYTYCKINKAEIVNCSAGDTVDFKVHDNDAGTISTVPNYMLNQFGFNVVMPDNFYVDESNYDADLILGMKVNFTYTNNTNSAKTIGINVTFHEIVSA